VAARLGAAVALAVGALAVLRPFLSAIAWGAILAYVTWPLFRRVRAWAKRPRLAAAVFSAGVAIGLGIPVGILLVTLADEATGLVGAFLEWRAAGAPLPGWIGESELLTRGLETLGSLLPADPSNAGELLAKAGTRISGRLVSVASGIARNAFTFSFTFVVLYGFYVGGEEILALGRRLAPLLFPAAPERFFENVGDAVRAVVFGLIGTALVQGILARWRAFPGRWRWARRRRCSPSCPGAAAPSRSARRPGWPSRATLAGRSAWDCGRFSW
jgi:predicted PurR-regulated permease PerM